jgi:DUF1680 family protein
VLLYRRTGEERYLAFAKEIVGEWSSAGKWGAGGMRLIEDALAGVEPMKIDSPKAHEMMSCFEGLCELYRATGERRYLDAAVALGQSIRKHERMVVGSGSNQELWCDGARAQTEVLEQPMETCVTVTWMKLCDQLLRLTGDPVWADEMEVSLYNALAGAMGPGGRWWAYHSMLQGERVPSHVQYGEVGLSCCVANGPRGMLLTPKWAVMGMGGGEPGVAVNLFTPGEGRVRVGDGEVRIVQETDYPVGDGVTLRVAGVAGGGKEWTLAVRVPGWSARTELGVNGEAVVAKAGEYAKIKRVWKEGDVVRLKLDMRGRAVAAPSGAPAYAVMRGPVVLAMDSRMVKVGDEAVRLVVDGEGFVDLVPHEGALPKGVWMGWDVGVEVRPSHFFNHRKERLAMCDYASAGDEWGEGNLMRVWVPGVMDLRGAFVPGTWRLMYPGARERPGMRGKIED